MATRKTRKKTTRRSNSNIQSAQRTATERRLERTKAAKEKQAKANETKLEPVTKTGAAGETRLEPVGGPLANRGRGVDQEAVAARDSVAGKSMLGAANKITGLAIDMQRRNPAQQQKRALADTSLYGNAGGKNAAARLAALMDAADKTRRANLTKTNSAVYLGPKIANAKIRNKGPERFDEGGADTTQAGPVGDDIRSKDELLAWLTDERVFNQIKKRMNDAGIDAQSYDDVAKLWTSILKQAADTYSTTGKKVTPWALISLRGKTMVGGRPANKTTVSSSIEEMDPAQARLMFEKSAADFLGRSATSAEIDDFISKAQMIAKQNPNITTTTTQYGIDGEPVSQQSASRGGADVVAARAQVAAMDMAKQDEEYGAFQAAGPMFGWLTDALQSPV